LINIQVKIIINDIACSSNKNRSNDEPNELNDILCLKKRLINAEIKK
jgi:hypothetical protein